MSMIKCPKCGYEANEGTMYCPDCGYKISDKKENAYEAAIGRAFEVGNINYLLDTFRNSYDKDKMKVNKNVFIMTVRRKIMDALSLQEDHNATQLRLIMQGSVEKITDCTLLKGICDIVLSVGNRALA